MEPDLIQIYKCLCDQTRLRILHLLTHGPLCVCHFQTILGLEQVPISKHLAYLREHRMVETKRRAQWVIYSLPRKLSHELHLQLRCLQDCVQSNSIFRQDLKKLRKLQCDCESIPQDTRPKATVS
jgi:ArsR family transcriptional regulator, arsenate/arsenite/antimonite-responsive transcriptional repressor